MVPRRSASSLRIIGLARCSTEEQANGLSIPAQKSRLAAYCKAHGHRLVRIEVEAGISGKLPIPRREVLSRVLEAVRTKDADGLLVVKLDRLSRRARDVMEIMDASGREGWALLSAQESLDTTTATGRAFVGIIGVLAQMEREQVGERTRAGMAEILREGRARSGRVPFGWRTAAGGTTVQAGDRRPLVEHEGEREILGRMVRLQAKGSGARRIASALNDAGTVNPRTRRPWSFGTVAAILRTHARRSAPTA